MADRSEVNASAIVAAGAFEPSARQRAVVRAEAIVGPAALIAAFLLMTAAIVAHAIG